MFTIILLIWWIVGLIGVIGLGQLTITEMWRDIGKTNVRWSRPDSLPVLIGLSLTGLFALIIYICLYTIERKYPYL